MDSFKSILGLLKSLKFRALIWIHVTVIYKNKSSLFDLGPVPPPLIHDTVIQKNKPSFFYLGPVPPPVVVKAVGSGGTRIGSPYYDKYPGAYKRPVRPGAGTERIEQGDRIGRHFILSVRFH
jgi:hypothetical protein